MFTSLLPFEETEEQTAHRLAAIAELDEQIKVTDQWIARLHEKAHRYQVNRGWLTLERSELVTHLAMPRHLTAEPPARSTWVPMESLPAHADASTSSLPTAPESP